jgi:hypothetical protein
MGGLNTYKARATQVFDKVEDYTLEEGDHKNVVVFNTPTDVVCIIPKGLRIGFSCTIIQEGVGKVSFATPDIDSEVNGGIITAPTKGSWSWAKILCLSEGKYTIDFGADTGGASPDIILVSQFGTRFSLAVLEETDEVTGLPNGLGSLTITKIP